MNGRQTSPDAEGFIRRLNGETPRGRILLEAGFLETLLREAILRRLADNKSSQELFGDDCSLGLKTLAKYARAFALIGEKELAALKSFADARNKIAHGWEADFSDVELQKIASRIQLVSVKGENSLPEHQKCFARLDYLGVFLIEHFVNRFAKLPQTNFGEGDFLLGITIDPVTGNRKTKVEPHP